MILKTKSLPKPILQIIVDKATEYPFTGEYTDTEQAGTYLCRHCGLALYRAQTKFHSGCGWPSFDAEIPGAVKHEQDRDGHRTEILCARCKAHLGHVFHGEHFTSTNYRHCVNSASLDFVTDTTVKDTEEVIIAAGCFWGVEYYFKKLTGILKTEVGYTGGHKDNPTYEEICRKNTGHVEALRIIYDPEKINFTKVIQYFFEIHDPTQTDGQGPDLGEQYLSVIFYYTDEHKKLAEKVKAELISKGLAVVTKILPVSVFWHAENYHQDYYTKTGHHPYCHQYVKRFDK